MEAIMNLGYWFAILIIFGIVAIGVIDIGRQDRKRRP
jgi:hypothetical protein